jgi:TonB family protein
MAFCHTYGVPHAAIKSFRSEKVFLMFFSEFCPKCSDRLQIYTNELRPPLTRNARLIWQCNGSDLTLYLRACEFLNSGGRVPVQWRFDYDTLASSEWLPSATGTAAFVPKDSVEGFTASTREGNRVLLRVYRGVSYDLEFSLNGLTHGLEMLDCKPPPAPPTAPVRVSSGVMEQQLVSSVPPTHPGIGSGTVLLDAIIGTDGRVQELNVIAGPRQFREATVEAVSQWIYKPTAANGKPVPVNTMIYVNFLSPEAKNTPQSLPERLRVSAGAIQEKLISSTPPRYPYLARQGRIRGVVLLEANISADGTIEDLRVITGHPRLVPAAMEAVNQWIYEPALINGQRVPVITTVSVNFVLPEPD